MHRQYQEPSSDFFWQNLRNKTTAKKDFNTNITPVRFMQNNPHNKENVLLNETLYVFIYIGQTKELKLL